MKMPPIDIRMIVLIYPPHWDTPMPPLGVAYVAAFLKSKGFEVQQIDLNHKFRYNYHLTDNDLDSRFNFEIEKRIFFERLGLDKEILLKLLSPDYFDKKKKEYKYEDLFREALRGIKCGCS